ncbi:MAG: hypothetical protein J3Q66DRAFT_390297 [Benniella sp.]|nr:MAG: hypothetical protein J3Q66DRAFT_390297 [Benniella sp.]
MLDTIQTKIHTFKKQSALTVIYGIAKEKKREQKGFDTDAVREAVLDSLHHMDSELQLIGKKYRLDEAQEKIRVAKRALWKTRQELLEVHRKENIGHGLELEKIRDLEEKLCADRGTLFQENSSSYQHYEVLCTNLLIAGGHQEATLGDIYKGALGQADTLGINVKLKELSFVNEKHQFPMSVLNVAGQERDWKSGVMVQNAAGTGKKGSATPSRSPHPGAH